MMFTMMMKKRLNEESESSIPCQAEFQTLEESRSGRRNSCPAVLSLLVISRHKVIQPNHTEVNLQKSYFPFFQLNGFQLCSKSEKRKSAIVHSSLKYCF